MAKIKIITGMDNMNLSLISGKKMFRLKRGNDSLRIRYIPSEERMFKQISDYRIN
jgi:hypothetical protein